MVTRLARQLGVMLLAIALAAAPVLAAQPRCCQSGAVKGSGKCCCGPIESGAVEANAAETAECCNRELPPCCAEHEEPAPEEAAFSSPPCKCKVAAQPPAITAGKDRVESSDGQFEVLAATAVQADASQQALLTHGHLHEAAPPGVSLNKVYCRWTV